LWVIIFASEVTVTATAAKGSAAADSTLTLVKRALKLMAWTKMKTAAVAGAVVLLTAGTAPDIQGGWAGNSTSLERRCL
jgi:hypothetical protein